MRAAGDAHPSRRRRTDIPGLAERLETAVHDAPRDSASARSCDAFFFRDAFALACNVAKVDADETFGLVVDSRKNQRVEFLVLAYFCSPPWARAASTAY